MPASSPDPYYYLANFERAIRWVAERSDDLLDADERAFIRDFSLLPRASRALLVRMVMRRGSLFRTARLVYEEIGCPLAASAPLCAHGWLDAAPLLTLDDVFRLVTKVELAHVFPDRRAVLRGRKSDALDSLRRDHPDARPYAQWHPTADDAVLQVTIGARVDRLRLLFFGNLHQDWSEFVLADLGVFQYEQVAFERSSRAFQCRADVDAYLVLHACRETLELLGTAHDDDAFDALLHVAMSDTDITAASTRANSWLAHRRDKLLFRLGQHCERRQDWTRALAVYQGSAYPGARHRRMRVLERAGRPDAALALARVALDAPESDAEAQRVARMLPRLHRALGTPLARQPAAPRLAKTRLVLPRPSGPFSVERIACEALAEPGTVVHYVENALLNSLFGLLCWDAIFAAVPGAFFHPFQSGPADLHAPDFAARRTPWFAAALAQLDGEDYKATILRHFHAKAGLQSPFVFWGWLTDDLLQLALRCLPAAHLKRCFERLMVDVVANRTGFPDLIRFWPEEGRYEMVEIKGPGDRLQDNQLRWLAYCAAHDMPMRVVHVEWEAA
ncbi:VRR-NUC domain-containing protein [Robbsia sp. Bb-Pol-6]|uniref:phosphodiesterase I n=1 Tax=Robbsia betulipollinis TaxID=2981849 RepID=A0ABT3ZI94_9BURK|nr:VRR-NUC domain-containing protein [Robbsia betulipollinis]